MAHSLCALRVECGGCCHCQRPPTSFRQLLLQAIFCNHRAKLSALLPSRPCPLYTTVFHSNSAFKSGQMQCTMRSVEYFTQNVGVAVVLVLVVGFTQVNVTDEIDYVMDEGTQAGRSRASSLEIFTQSSQHRAQPKTCGQDRGGVGKRRSSSAHAQVASPRG